MLLGPSGCGKSDLLLRLIDRGFVLVADDRVDMQAGFASPARGLEGLVEMRGLGILRLVHGAPRRVVLACELGAPCRLPEPVLHPLGMPLLRLDAQSSSAPLVVGHALDVLEGRTVMHAGALA